MIGDPDSTTESGRMRDSHSTEPWFESSVLPFRRSGFFVLSTTAQFTQLNKRVSGYIDSGENMSELSSRSNCSVAECFLKKSHPVSG